MSLKIIHVYDLDGVLVDTSHRYRVRTDGCIDLDYWYLMRTPENVAKDKLLPLHKQYVKDCMSNHVYTILCTARNYHPVDIQFIVGHLGMPDKLIMKPASNTRFDDDAIYKFRELQRLFNLKQFRWLPRRLWEDNLKNIEKLRPLFSRVTYVPSHIGNGS